MNKTPLRIRSPCIEYINNECSPCSPERSSTLKCNYYLKYKNLRKQDKDDLKLIVNELLWRTYTQLVCVSDECRDPNTLRQGHMYSLTYLYNKLESVPDLDKFLLNQFKGAFEDELGKILYMFLLSSIIKRDDNVIEEKNEDDEE